MSEPKIPEKWQDIHLCCQMRSEQDLMHIRPSTLAGLIEEVAALEQAKAECERKLEQAEAEVQRLSNPMTLTETLEHSRSCRAGYDGVDYLDGKQ